MREVLVMAALFIAIAADPLRAMNVMALPIAFESPSCEDAAAVGSCGSLVLAQTRTPVGRIHREHFRLSKWPYRLGSIQFAISELLCVLPFEISSS
jgi:hypothetical protein